MAELVTLLVTVGISVAHGRGGPVRRSTSSAAGARGGRLERQLSKMPKTASLYFRKQLMLVSVVFLRAVVEAKDA